MTLIEPEVIEQPSDFESRLVHYKCCLEMTAICGKNLTGDVQTTNPVSCVVCLSLEEAMTGVGCGLRSNRDCPPWAFL